MSRGATILLLHYRNTDRKVLSHLINIQLLLKTKEGKVLPEISSHTLV